MKRLEKLFALLTVFAVMLGMSMSAFAAGQNSITVDKNFEGQEYALYKIFDATVNEARATASDMDSDTSVTVNGIAYTLVDEETTADSGHGLTATYSITLADGSTKSVAAGDWFEYVNSSSKNIQIKENADITTEEFRLFAQKYGVKTGETLTAKENDDKDIRWTGLEDGYYFISTTTGTLVTVDSIAPNAIVKDKNSIPSVDKTVEENSTGEYQKQNDGEIGQTINYMTVIAAKKGGAGYKLLDKMSEGLTFDGISSVKVYKGSVSDDNLLTVDREYTVTAGGEYSPAAEGTPAVTADFTLEFKQAFLNTITEDTDLIVTYSAKINDKAVINTAEINKTTLVYGNNTRTAESETKTFVWGIDLLKYDGEDESKATVLKDAEFVLYKKVQTEKESGIQYAKFDSNMKFAGWTDVDTETVENLLKKEKAYFSGKDATILVTDEDGKIAVTGLDQGEYFLIEVTAPAGYNKLDKEEKVEITSTVASAGLTNETDISSGTDGSTHVDVANNQGAVLPSTGGIGTTLFYIIGAILVIGAGAVLLIRQRRN